MPLDNFGVVSERGDNFLYRSAQPDREGYIDAKYHLGVSHIFKLNHGDIAHNVLYDQLTFSRYNMAPYQPRSGQILRIVDEMDAYLEKGSALVHCTYGRDRTGVVIAAYRMKVEGWNYEQAYDDMTTFAGRGAQAMPFFDHEFLEFLQNLGYQIEKDRKSVDL